MGFKITKYTINGLDPNSQVRLGDVQLCSDPRSVITGTIVDCELNPVPDAVVKVFATCDINPCDCDALLIDLGHVFTDDCGQFIFPVCPGEGQQFLIKIFAVDTNFQDISPTRCFPGECCPTCPPCPEE